MTDTKLIIIDINGSHRECLSVSHDAQYPGYVRVEFASNRETPATYFEWYPIDDFLQSNPNLSHVVNKDKQPAPDDLGKVSSATSDSLTDKAKKWVPDSYKGFPIWISRGLGEGQVRTVISNTKNSVKVDKPFEVKPDKSSQYVLTHNIHEVQVLGNTLPS